MAEKYKRMMDGELSDDFRHFLDRALADSPRSLTDYEILTSLLAEVGFSDLWKARNATPGYTSHMDKRRVAEEICPPHEDGPNLDSHPRVKFCDDFSAPADPPFSFREDNKQKKSDRIDYIFVSQPSVGQSFTVDFTRPRRLRLQRDRDAPGRDEIAFLSDHIGLMTTMLLAPA